MFKFCSKFFITLFILFIFPFITTAQEMTTIDITSDGISTIINSNTAKAREHTIDSALKKAVEQAIGTMISESTIEKHSQGLEDHIYSNAKAYVQTFKVLSEKVTGNIYQATVQSTIIPAVLKRELVKLGLIVSTKNMPRVLVMVEETDTKGEDSEYWWENDSNELRVTESAIITKLVEKGFKVVNHIVLSEKGKIPSEYKTDSLSNDAIKEIGSLFRVDIVVYGKAVASTLDFATDASVISSQADISLKAVSVSSGQTIATSVNHESAVHINAFYAGNEALRKATEKISDKFLVKIIKRWRKAGKSSHSIKVVISGIKSYTDFINFKDILSNKIKGVTAVSQRGFSSGVATLNLYIEGSSQNIADELTLIEYENIAIDITGITPRGMQIKMRSQ